MDVQLVSCTRLPEPDHDAEPLLAALARAGLSTRLAAWDDPALDWSLGRIALLRSCWNYPHHAEAFLRWAEAAASVTALWNPLPLVRWNLHKRYLLDLEREGLSVAPTRLLPRGDVTTLQDLIDREQWETVVVKPAISAASLDTMRFGPTDREAGERHLRSILARRDALVQPYLASVERHGERALVWIDGALTHAVRKSPRFHGQAEAVSPEPVSISAAERSLAEQTLSLVAPRPLYARIDVAPGPDGRPVVMELELIEPSLFFAQCPAALDRLVSAVTRLVDLDRIPFSGQRAQRSRRIESMPIEPGQRAPAFTLTDERGRKVSLEDFRGQDLILYFYPKDDTPGCTKEACGFRDAWKEISKRGAVVLGVSPDGAESHLQFVAKYRLPFPLLSDPDRKMMTKYGAYGEKTLYGRKSMGVIRSTVWIGPDGKVKRHWKRVSDAAEHPERVLEALRSEA